MVQNERLGLYSILVNLLLVGIKAILAFLCGSVALMADTIHSFSDVISSATVLAGIKISKRKSKVFGTKRKRIGHNSQKFSGR